MALKRRRTRQQQHEEIRKRIRESLIADSRPGSDTPVDPTPAPPPSPNPIPPPPIANLIDRKIAKLIEVISSVTTAANVARFIRNNAASFIRTNAANEIELDAIAIADQVEAQFASDLSAGELSAIRNAYLNPWSPGEAAELRDWITRMGGSGYEEGLGAAADPFEMLTADELAAGGAEIAADAAAAAEVAEGAVAAAEAVEGIGAVAEGVGAAGGIADIAAFGGLEVAEAASAPTAAAAIAGVGSAVAETLSGAAAAASATIAAIGEVALEILPFAIFL